MATYNNATVTARGLAILSDLQAGYLAGLNFVSARTGNGIYDGTENLSQMTALKSQKQTFNVDSVTRIGGNALRVQFTVSNKLGESELQTGYDIRELGIFVSDGEDTVLFAIVTAQDGQYDHLGAYDGVMAQTMTISFFFEVSSDAEVTITAPNDNDLVTYGSIGGMFAETEHTHTTEQITDFEHTHTTEQITDFDHTHPVSEIDGFPNSLPASDVPSWAKQSTKPSYTKAEIGLGNVDNTADANKSVSYATTAGSANAVTWGNVSGKPSAFTPASHSQAAGTITAGTLPVGVVATNGTDYTASRLRNIRAGTTDLTAGTSSLTNGTIYVVYE